MALLSSDDLGRLTDILTYARRIERHLGAIEYDTFAANDLLSDAVIRCEAVIGEAAWRVGPEVQAAYPAIPWPLMATMRHRLVHDYGGTDLQIVYRVATESIPDLIEQVSGILRKHAAQ